MTVLNHADAIYLGSRKVDKIMLGAAQVWPPAAPAGVSVDSVTGTQGRTSDVGWAAPGVPLIFNHTVSPGCTELLIFLGFGRGRYGVNYEVTVDGVSAELLHAHLVDGTYSDPQAIVMRLRNPSPGVKEIKVYVWCPDAAGTGLSEARVSAAAVSLKGTGTLAGVYTGHSAATISMPGVPTPAIGFHASNGVQTGYSDSNQTVLHLATFDANLGYAMYITINTAPGVADFTCTGPASGNSCNNYIELDA